MAKADIKTQKNEIRERLRNETREYLALNKSASDKICKLLQAVLPKDTQIGSYRAMSDELSVDGLQGLGNFRLAFPRIEGDSLSFYVPHHQDSFILNSYQILEPDYQSAQKVELKDLGVLLVPGLGFDRKFRRIGRGKGYYDRLLKNFTGLKIGICTLKQVSQFDLPVEDHDVEMDLIVTDEFVLKRFDT